jgi:hypothetical protein
MGTLEIKSRAYHEGIVTDSIFRGAQPIEFDCADVRATSQANGMIRPFWGAASVIKVPSYAWSNRSPENSHSQSISVCVALRRDFSSPSVRL